MQDVTGTKGDVQYRYRVFRSRAGDVYVIRDTWLGRSLVALQVALVDEDGDVVAWEREPEGFEYATVKPTLKAVGPTAESIAEAVVARIKAA